MKIGITSHEYSSYDGSMHIEHEDPVFEGNRWEEGIWRGASYLRPLLPPQRKK